MFRTEVLINYSIYHHRKKIEKKADQTRAVFQTKQMIESIKKHDIVQLIKLIEEKADINLKDEKFSPLRVAVQCDHIDIVKLLLAEGAKISKEILPIALHRGDATIIKLLLKYNADVNQTYHHSLTCLHLAAFSCTRMVVEILIKHRAKINAYDDFDETPLIYAIKAKNADVVDLFLEQKADFHFFTLHGKTPLHHSIHEGHKKITRNLLKHGANPNTQDTLTGFTALHLSLFNKHFHLVQLLLNHGAKVHIKDRLGFTPVHWAVDDFVSYKKITAHHFR
jgi:ankyrin repeat protein